MKATDRDFHTAAEIAAQAWRAAMDARNKSCVMPPWDEATWCQPPAVTRYTLQPGVDTIVAQSYPNRIWLAFSVPIQVGNYCIVRPGPFNNVVQADGFWLVNGTLPFIITQKDTINLAGYEWHAQSNTGPADLIVVEVAMRDWPR